MTKPRSARVLFKPLARPARAPRPIRRRRSALIDWAAYVDGLRVLDHSAAPSGLAEAVRIAEEKDGFVWVGLYEPDADELENIAEIFGLHPLAVEDAIHAHQRPKLERYDGVQFFVMKTVGYVQRDVVETGEVMIFCGPRFVVTVRHGTTCALGSLREDLEEEPDRLALGPAAVLHAITDRVVDGYVQVAAAVQDDIGEVEESVFSAERTDESRQIYQLKREVIQLKRAVGPLAEPLHTLVGRRFVPSEIKEYFRDVEDHLTRVREQVEACDELLTPILQAHMTQVTIEDNKDMRKISAWGAILMVPTAIAGIYGMNFDHMPELGFLYSYPVVLGGIGLICLSLYRGFRRNGWL